MPFKKGKDWNGNRKGRPEKPEVQELRDALEAVKQDNNGKGFIRMFAEAAVKELKSKKSIKGSKAETLFKKLVPDNLKLDFEDNSLTITIKTSNKENV